MNTEPQPVDSISDDELNRDFLRQLRYVCDIDPEDDYSISRVIATYKEGLASRGYDEWQIEVICDETFDKI